MPIDTDSERWQNSDVFDWTAVHVREFLSEGEAYSLDEIAHELLEEKPSVIPQSLREEPSLFKAYLFRVLERQSLRNLIDDRVVTTPEGDTDIYYTESNKSGVFPLAKIQDIYPQQFDSINKGLDETDEELAEIRDRIQTLEYQFRQEHR